MSDVNPHLHSLLLLVPMATRVRACLYVCLWERYPVDMRGHMWTYPRLDPLCSVTRAGAAALGSVKGSPGGGFGCPLSRKHPPNHAFIMGALRVTGSLIQGTAQGV